MSRRGRRIADVDSPIATVKTLFGSDGALAGGGDGDSSGTFVYFILSCTFILKAFLIYSFFFFFSSAFADDEGPFVPPVDLDALDAEIAADKLAQEAEASESCPEQIN